VKTTQSERFFSYWEASDYLESPRRIRALNLCVTTFCQMQCIECAIGIPRIRYPEHYSIEYIRHAAACFHGIEHVTITGGEPTMHPDFHRFAPHLREWFGCTSLALETNGFRIAEHKELLPLFDDILLSHYPQNSREAEFLAELGFGSRPKVPTLHVTLSRRARHPRICKRANFVMFVYGRVYPCACIPGGYENLGIPLTPRWREAIARIPLPCGDCWFAEEANNEYEADRDRGIHLPDPSLITFDNASQDAPDVRPSWRWPYERSNVKIFGLDLDSWMGSTARIQVNPQHHMNRLLIHFESHAPLDLHPLTITFARENGEVCVTHEITRPGLGAVELDLPTFFPTPGSTEIVVTCDKTIEAPQKGVQCAMPRELGIRIKSTHLLSSEADSGEALRAEHIRLLDQCGRELAAKEKFIQSQQREIEARDRMIRKFRHTSLYVWLHDVPARLAKNTWKAVKRKYRRG